MQRRWEPGARQLGPSPGHVERAIVDGGAQELDHEERVPLRAAEVLEQAVARRRAGDLFRHCHDVVVVELSQPEVQGSDLPQAVGDPTELRCRGGRSERGDEDEGKRFGAAPEGQDQGEARGIGPLEVVEREQQRALACDVGDQGEHRLVREEPGVGGRAPPASGHEHSRHELAHLGPARIRRARATAERVGDDAERAAGLELLTGGAQHLEPGVRRERGVPTEQTGLADPGLTLDQYRLARTRGGSIEQLLEPGELVGASVQFGRKRLSAGLRACLAHTSPSPVVPGQSYGNGTRPKAVCRLSESKISELPDVFFGSVPEHAS